MQKYTKYVKICKNHPRHLYKFLLSQRGPLGGAENEGLELQGVPWGSPGSIKCI